MIQDFVNLSEQGSKIPAADTIPTIFLFVCMHRYRFWRLYLCPKWLKLWGSYIKI